MEHGERKQPAPPRHSSLTLPVSPFPSLPTQPPRKARTPDPKFYAWNDALLKGGEDLEFINFLNWALPYMKVHKGNETKFIADCADIGAELSVLVLACACMCLY